MQTQDDSGTNVGDEGEILQNTAMGVMSDMANPQPEFAKLIPQHVVSPMEGMALPTSREAVETVLRDHEGFSSEFGLDLGNTLPLIPLSVDPPRHSKYRKILDPLFSPRRMDALEDDIAARVNRFIDGFIDDGECNFTEDFAEQFPSSVFLSLLGLPWSELDNMLRLRDGILRPEMIDEMAAFDPEVRQKIARDTGQMIYDYFDAILAEKREKPGEDLLTHFIQAEIDGEKLSREDILGICFLFVLAGLDTVSDSLTCFYAFLAQNDQHRLRIVNDSDVIPNAVEEMLRWESPVPMVPRMATADIEVCGVTIPAGTMVTPMLGSANVDEAGIESPFEVDFDRSVNKHLAFGGGVHRCLGSHLARRELRVTLKEWHRRIPEYRIKPGHENLEYRSGLRTVKDLMLVW